MKGPSIDQVVYNCMFPKPKATDPQNFQSLLQQLLVPEVRHETQDFYGHISSQEAKYPGLDYSYKPHRVRLSRFQWHRRLFRAFDNLGLTKGEIAALTKWEGTRWAKERFEREQGIVIRDTTADIIEDWVEHEQRVAVPQAAQRADVEDMGDLVEEEIEETEEQIAHESSSDNQVEDDQDAESDSEMQSVGLELNERLRAAVAQREAGDATVTMDEAWEKWYLERLESGGTPAPYDIQPMLSPNTNIPGTRPSQGFENTVMFQRWLSAGRAGQWHTVPTMVHPFVRQELDNITRRERASPTSSSSSSQDAPPSSPSPTPLSSGRLPSIHDLISSSHMPASTDSAQQVFEDHPRAPSNANSAMPLDEWRTTRNQYGTRHSLMASAPPPFRGSLTRHRRTLFGREDAQFSNRSRS